MRTIRKLGETLIPVPSVFKTYFHKDLPEDIPFDYTDQIYAGFDSCGVPIIIPKDYNSYDYRETLLPIVGYTLVTKNVCKALASFIKDKKVLEIMAGTGCLTYGLRSFGVNIHATDDYSEELLTNFWIKDLEQLDCIESVRKYGSQIDYLLISWCAQKAPILTVIQLLKHINPKAQIIYIGETKGGCTGNDALWDMVTPIRYNNFYEAVLCYRSWYGLHDRPFLLRIN
ncbi:hypothetical protein PBV87_01480 [Niameybacter massiliensis]|uniref:Methyltransferase n=1 Tax=Holtiella tumoricola TaxID=3018743 RepID=A0AA42IYV0_9FIRM|nr:MULTISPECIES: hypothetical protein [Lachnospirales]MDA3730187.1 hypothetical protein [Holtiella tumoricola]